VLFLQIFLGKWFPRLWDWLFDTLVRDMSRKAFPGQRREWNLSPAPSVATTPPLIADAVYPFLESGFAEPVAAVQRIAGPNSVQLTDGRLLHGIDTIIYTTGYESAVPFAPAEYNPYPVADEAPVLYRNIFPLHSDADVRNSLAFLGQGGITFPGFVQFELVVCAVSQIWRGRSRLPPLDAMQAWHAEHMAWRRDVVRRSKFDTKFMTVMMRLPDQMAWLDDTAGTGVFAHFSWFSWRAWRFWWRDRSFYNLCKSGLLSPALWRLFDMGGRKPWARAKEQIIRDNEIAEKRREERRRAVEKIRQDQKDR
jgi:dimethylaniline monooxygenase (N-oxide forming)